MPCDRLASHPRFIPSPSSLVLCYLSSGAYMRVNKGHVKVSAQVGHSVNITCPYNILSRQSQKSWCRGKLYDSCKTMVSTLGPMTNGRVSIWDDPSNGAFHVTMSALTEKDAGWYQCVKSGFLQPQTFSHVYLNVTKGDENRLHFLPQSTITYSNNFPHTLFTVVTYTTRYTTYTGSLIHTSLLLPIILLCITASSFQL
uniref:Ig-like domain-containing protein n=1 Tax=Scleropages formosus TaxID=113540 RepID=A0A8C9RFS0_SCLFO